MPPFRPSSQLDPAPASPRGVAGRSHRPDRDPGQPRIHGAAGYARALLSDCGLAAKDDVDVDVDVDVGSDIGSDTGSAADRRAPIENLLGEGRTSPSPALDWARSGAMALMGAADEAPRFAAGPLAMAARGAGRALAALAPGTPLTRLDAPALLGERAAILGLARRGGTSAGGSARLLPTRDGWIALNLPREEDWGLVPAWLEMAPRAFSVEDWPRIARTLVDRRSEELIARGRLMGLAVAPASRKVASDLPWMACTPTPTPTPMPTAMPTKVKTTRTNSPSVGRRIRLLDLSHLWAGPLATSLLALAGIDVLKLESPTRPDGARRGPRAFFDLLQGGKRGGALDLHRAQDRARFEVLLEQADVVVESARPRALEQLGYDAGSWLATRPGRIWASITGYGRRGEQRDWIAFGDDAAVAAGLAWPAADADGESKAPCFCGDAIADPLTGLHAAVGILAHLRAGRGGLLDFSLVGVSAHAASAPLSATSEALVLPVMREGPTGWSVIENQRAIPVASPRTRRPLAPAPALTPMRAGGGWDDADGPC